jgi:hypothetical protein
MCRDSIHPHTDLSGYDLCDQDMRIAVQVALRHYQWRLGTTGSSMNRIIGVLVLVVLQYQFLQTEQYSSTSSSKLQRQKVQNLQYYTTST